MRALVIAACLLPFAAYADCAESSWQFTPRSGATLPTNGRITIEGYGVAQQVVSTMRTRNPRLVSGEVEIPLKVVETNVGEFHVTQVVLKAKGALPEGERFTLRFDHTDDARFDAPWWTIARADFTPPAWKSPPVAKAGHFAQYGCGPVVEAVITVPVAGALQMRARVIGSKKTREYLIDLEQADLAVGHGMCSGPFRIDDDEWSLELTAIDAAGNATAAPGAPLRFKGINPG